MVTLGQSRWFYSSSKPGTGASPEAAWPVGSVFVSTVPDDPATLLGFGTWELVEEGTLTLS